MKIRPEFVMREVAGAHIVLPCGTTPKVGILKLNDTGAFLWKRLENGADKEELLSALKDAYTVTDETAIADLEHFLERIRGIDALDENE